MKTDYTVLSRFKNKQAVDELVLALRGKSFSCYNFCDESLDDYSDIVQVKHIFERDLAGLKNADTAILLQPAGISSHTEAGIAYGLGKKLIMIGKPEKPETLYHIFKERYETIEEFLKTV